MPVWRRMEDTGSFGAEGGPLAGQNS